MEFFPFQDGTYSISLPRVVRPWFEEAKFKYNEELRLLLLPNQVDVEKIYDDGKSRRSASLKPLFKWLHASHWAEHLAWAFVLSARRRPATLSIPSDGPVAHVVLDEGFFLPSVRLNIRVDPEVLLHAFSLLGFIHHAEYDEYLETAKQALGERGIGDVEFFSTTF